jgi:hypothetical protein
LSCCCYKRYVWSSTTASVAGMLDSIMQGDPPAAAAAGLDVPMQIEFIPPRLAVRTAIYHRHGGWMLGHGRAGERDNEPYQRGVVLIQRPAASARGAGAARLTTHGSRVHYDHLHNGRSLHRHQNDTHLSPFPSPPTTSAPHRPLAPCPC